MSSSECDNVLSYYTQAVLQNQRVALEGAYDVAEVPLPPSPNYGKARSSSISFSSSRPSHPKLIWRVAYSFQQRIQFPGLHGK